MKNQDLFYKDISDGISCVLYGSMAPLKQPLIFVGGNCSILGFDHKGEEQYWNVCGDNVTSLAFCDIDLDGEDELIVGSEDNVIRVYKEENILMEITEGSKAIQLVNLGGDRFAFALDNGNVGVYKQKSRRWRVKSKFKAVSLVFVQQNSNNYYALKIFNKKKKNYYSGNN